METMISKKWAFCISQFQMSYKEHGNKMKSGKKVKDVGEIGVLLRGKLSKSFLIKEENYRQK